MSINAFVVGIVGLGNTEMSVYRRVHADQGDNVRSVKGVRRVWLSHFDAFSTDVRWGTLATLLRHLQSKNVKHRILNSDDAAFYLQPLFAGHEHERFVMLCLDESFSIISQLEIEGDVDSVDLSIQKLIHEVARVGATSVVIAHNHPNDDAAPSRADLDMTKQIARGCQAIGARCLDHLIITKDKTLSLRARGLL